MPYGTGKIDVKSGIVPEPPHVCDPKPPCDPFFEANECPTPYLCTEKIKNPALPGEITTCKPGPFMNVKACAKVEPPHVCDPLPPCVKKEGRKKKPECREPPLILEKVKNPQNNMKEEPCTPYRP